RAAASAFLRFSSIGWVPARSETAGQNYPTKIRVWVAQNNCISKLFHSIGALASSHDSTTLYKAPLASVRLSIKLNPVNRHETGRRQSFQSLRRGTLRASVTCA